MNKMKITKRDIIISTIILIISFQVFTKYYFLIEPVKQNIKYSIKSIIYKIYEKLTNEDDTNVKTFSKYIGKIPYIVKIYKKNEIYDGKIYSAISAIHNKEYKNQNVLFTLSSDGESNSIHKVGKYHVFKKIDPDKLGFIKEFCEPQWGIADSVVIISDKNFKSMNKYYPKNHTSLYSSDAHDFLILTNKNCMILGYDKIFKKKSVFLQPFIQEVTPKNELAREYKIDDITTHIESYNYENIYNPVDVFHTNSIWIDFDENILVSNRNTSQIIKIDRKTGDIIWRFGGKGNQFKFINDRYNGFSYQHGASRNCNGNILLFDNGNEHIPPQTRVLEYNIDEKNKTATLVWEYYEKEMFCGSMGYVQELENKNKLITWGKNDSENKYKNFFPQITEVNNKGKKVMEILMPKGVYLYRAYKFD